MSIDAVDVAENVAAAAPDRARSDRRGEQLTTTVICPPAWKSEASIDTAGPPEHALTSVSIATAVDRATAAADAGLRCRAAACAAAELAACTCASVSTSRPIQRMRTRARLQQVRSAPVRARWRPHDLHRSVTAAPILRARRPQSPAPSDDVPRNTPGASPVIVTTTAVAVVSTDTVNPVNTLSLASDSRGGRAGLRCRQVDRVPPTPRSRGRRPVPRCACGSTSPPGSRRTSASTGAAPATRSSATLTPDRGRQESSVTSACFTERSVPESACRPPS